MSTRDKADPSSNRDQGSTLILVLVLTVLSALVVVPMLRYAVSVTIAGRVQSDKAQATESARSGLRTALVNAAALYERCGTTPAPLASNGVADVQSTCQVVSTENYRDLADTPYQAAVVQVGQTIPTPFDVSGLSYTNPNTSSDESAWLAARRGEGEQNTVWTPSLPSRPVSERTTAAGPPHSYGRTMSLPDGSICNVYYPGTYTYPIEVRGPNPAYFVSGIYYFESTLTFTSGVTAVIGEGGDGCALDAEAVAYVADKPEITHWNGSGATFVLGKDARIVIDNSGGPVSVTFNQRYVQETDVSVRPSAGVSIISVDGDIDADPSAISDLFVDDLLSNPSSTVVVNDTTVPVEAGRDGYRPSVHTPEPLPPGAPTSLVATAYRTGNCATCGAATLTWNRPSTDNGFATTGYVVRDAANGQAVTCVLSEPVTPFPVIAGEPERSCTIVDLASAVERTFYVTALNAGGESPASNQVDVRPRTSNPQRSPLLVAPGNLTNTQIDTPVVYSNGALISFVDGTSPNPWNGGTPVTLYTVTATPNGPPGPNVVVSCTSAWWPRQCLLPADDSSTPVIDGLVAGAQYTVRVVATNMIGSGAPPSSGKPLTFNPTSSTSAYAPHDPRPPDTIRVPDPIIDVRSTGANKITLVVPGYVAVAQGRIRVDGLNDATKNIHDIEFLGGVLAARLDIAYPPDTMRLELLNPVIQKTIRLVTTLSGNVPVEGVAILQINDNNAWALNSWVVQ